MYIHSRVDFYSQPVIRIYDIPNNTFESDDEDDEDDDETETSTEDETTDSEEEEERKQEERKKLSPSKLTSHTM